MAFDKFNPEKQIRGLAERIRLVMRRYTPELPSPVMVCSLV